MEDRFVVKGVEERLAEWRELDRQALEVEAEVAALGQAAADPRARDLLLRARELREKADREFSAILRAVKVHRPDEEADGDLGRRA